MVRLSLWRAINAIAVVSAVMTSAGCIDYGPIEVPPATVDNTIPLKYTYVGIGQRQYNGPGPDYSGNIEYPACMVNPNDHELHIRDGYEVFQRIDVPTPTLRLVAKHEFDRNSFAAQGRTIPLGLTHAVYVNETAEGGTNYTVHFWNEVLLPEPVYRQDLWFNMTFIPYGPDRMTYEQGEPC